MRKTINIEKMVQEVRTYLVAADQHMKVGDFVSHAEHSLNMAKHILTTLYVMLQGDPNAIGYYNLKEYDTKWVVLTAKLRSMK